MMLTCIRLMGSQLAPCSRILQMDCSILLASGSLAESLHADVAIKHVHVGLGADGELHITPVIEPVHT